MSAYLVDSLNVILTGLFVQLNGYLLQQNLLWLNSDRGVWTK